mmetsp:Transcript_26571/g.44935  ORF Transcript_26571/g.44935 Transcript_26571/m.44935 type:complete len:354 (+) Transcript_26571:89-1150(+)
MERASGRTRRVSQKMAESREIFVVPEEGTSKRKAAKSSHKESVNADTKSQKGGSDAISKSTPIYHIPAPVNQPVNTFIPSSVALSLLDKAEQITVSEDRMTCTGVEGGFRMIRATHGVNVGPYYWECEILPPPSDGDDTGLTPHVRVGWSTRFGELRGPVGYDKHSFGYRDVAGSKVHQRMRDDSYGEPFGVGDVVGCLIDLGHSEACSEIRFFKNGMDQGRAYGPEVGAAVTRGVYFPAISLFGKAQVRVNFGPSFIEPIDSTQFKFNSFCDVQPMNAREIAEHDKHINEIRERRKQTASCQNPANQSPTLSQPPEPPPPDQLGETKPESTVMPVDSYVPSCDDMTAGVNRS